MQVSRARACHGRLTVDARFNIELPANIREEVRLRIVFPHLYPLHPPSAFILGDIFSPRNQSRHFMDDGSCCLFLPGVDGLWNPSDPLALDLWLDQVTLFVVRQILFDRLGRWPGGEWPHGFAAYDRHVRETIGYGLVEHFYRHRRLGIPGNQECPCGSHRLFSDCHRGVFEELKIALSGRASRQVQKGTYEVLNSCKDSS
jgi:hypothetical protein